MYLEEQPTKLNPHFIVPIKMCLDFFPKGFSEDGLAKALNSLGETRRDYDMLMETASFEEIDDYYNPGVDLISQDFIIEAIAIDKFSRTEKRMAAVVRVLNKHLTDSNISALQPIVGKPRKSGSFAYVTVQLPFSDGQVVSVIFHAPEGDKQKIGPDDQIIAFRWLLNKRDITQVVSPEEGAEVSLETIGKRITQLVVKNSGRFVAQQKDAIEEQNALEKTQEGLKSAEERQVELRAEIAEASKEMETVYAQLTSTQALVEKQKGINAELEAKLEGLRKAGGNTESTKPVSAKQVSQENTGERRAARNIALLLSKIANGLNAQGFNFEPAEIKRAIAAAKNAWSVPNVSAENLVAQWTREGLTYTDAAAVVPARLVPEKRRVAQPEGASLEEIYKLNLGAKNQFLEAVQSAASKTGGTLSQRPGIGVKGRARAIEKTMNENDGDFSRLIDIVGAAIIYQGGQAAIKAAVPTVIATLQSQGWKLEKVKDRYLNPAGGGYKDVLMNFSHEIVNENGKAKHVVVELQLLTAAMNQMKNAGPGHAVYEAARTIRPLVLDKKAHFGRGERARAKKILEHLNKISEKLYAAADKEISANASDIGITELSKLTETARTPLSSSTNLTSSMRTVVDKAEEALASILKMYPSSVPIYGTSLNSRNLRTTNDDGLSSSGNSNSVGNETVEPSGSVNGTNMGTPPDNNSSTTLNNVSENGTEGKPSEPVFVATLNDILAGKYGDDAALLGKVLRETLAQIRAANAEEQYKELFQKALNVRTEILRKKVESL